MHHINGKTTIGRFKENFTSGGLLFVDRDRQPSMPAQLETASDDDFFAQLERLVPGISSAERLAYSSSSSRVLLPDGLPAFNGTPSRHYWLRLATDIDQDSIRLALTVAAGAADLMFTATDKHGKKRLNRTVLDLSVYSTEREIFDSPPAVNAPLQCAKGDYQISNLGGGSVIIEPAQAVPFNPMPNAPRPRSPAAAQVASPGALITSSRCKLNSKPLTALSQSNNGLIVDNRKPAFNRPSVLNQNHLLLSLIALKSAVLYSTAARMKPIF
ncbi:hypothetical protein [Chromatium okenii]|uniref:Uncharacterized protein n=1 Tax=Chromatium okenii TaxID=61644 RepID=A0A2S7XTL1_9GAMM|nr:hypothetical protein [Chromatium okenii]PQJ96828.1 hypothetical protein CXB77_05645 [Chromatium okenii]